MGTSVSHRSPNVPRWNAVIRRILDEDDPQNIQAELFNAGSLDGWDKELGRGAVGRFVEALVEAHGSFGDALTTAERPELAVQRLVDTVRQRALAEEGAPGVALAERAFARTLLITTRAPAPPAGGAAAESPAERWESARGSPPELVRRFLGEVLHQYTSHVVARDAGQLLGRPGFERVMSVRRLERELSQQARGLAGRVEVEGSAPQLVARWSEYVERAFREGAALPDADG
jgi:hypothetical protein